MTIGHKVLILTTKKSDLAEHLLEFKQFTRQFQVLIYVVESKAALRDKLQTDFNNVSAIWVTGEAIDHHGGVLEFIDYFPRTMKVYVYPFVGYLKEESEAMRDRGIAFCNVGDISAHDVADHALFLTISVFKLCSFVEKQFRLSMSTMDCRDILGSQSFDIEGEPTPAPEGVNLAYSACIGGKKLESPTGKIAGIVGFGSIGKQIGRRLNAIGMEVRYTKRTPLHREEESRLGYSTSYVPAFDDLISQVDLLVLCVPHTPDTTDLINRETLKRVKRGIRIVNVGRGSAIDEEALIDALDNGVVAAAGLDVYKNEPKVNPKLNRWDVTLTPHVANLTTDNTINVNLRCIKNIKDVLLEGGTGLTPV